MRDTTALQPLIDHALQGLRPDAQAPDAQTPDAEAMALHHDRLLETLGAVTGALASAFSRAAETELRTAADALDTLYCGRRANPRLRRHPGHLIQGRSRGQLETQRNIVHVNAIGARTQIVKFAEADIARLHRLVRDFEIARADSARLLAAADTPARRVAAIEAWTIADRAMQILDTQLSALVRETTLGITDELRAAYRLADNLLDRNVDVAAPEFAAEVRDARDALRSRAAKLAQGARWIRKADTAIRAAEPHDHQLRLAMSGLASGRSFSLNRPPEERLHVRRHGISASSAGRRTDASTRNDSSDPGGNGLLVAAGLAATGVAASSCDASSDSGGGGGGD
jgi:hypothetical protein